MFKSIMCGCLVKMEEIMLEAVSKTLATPVRTEIEVKSSGFVNETWIMPKLIPRLQHPFRVEYEYSTKKGKRKIAKKVMNLSPSYCGFCGESFKP